MEKLIINSVNILKEGINIDVIYGWMDLGDVICEKLRSNIPLKAEEVLLINKFDVICNRIKLDNNITLYRGTSEKFNPSVAGKQFIAMSPNINTAETYGAYITKVIVPTNRHAFYISAWELINEEIETQEEKEVLLLPGMFTLYEEENGITTYIYEEKNFNVLILT